MKWGGVGITPHTIDKGRGAPVCLSCGQSTTKPAMTCGIEKIRRQHWVTLRMYVQLISRWDSDQAILISITLAENIKDVLVVYVNNHSL